MKEKLQTAFSTRQYMHAKDFEIYYYSDLDLSKVGEHFHDYYEFYFFIEGDVSIIIEQTEYEMKKGDLFILLPNIRHCILVHSNKPYRRFVLWVSKAYMDHMLELSPDYGYLLQHVKRKREYIFHNDMILFHEMQSKIFLLLEEIHSNRFARNSKIAIGVNEIILHLNRIIYEKHNPIQKSEESALYQRLVSYIEGHLEEDLSLGHLAERFFVSKYHIAHVFKEKVGLSVHQYITKKRLKMCKDGLIGNLSIGELCVMAGFKDYSCFYRAFKKEYAISPKQYREHIIEVHRNK